MTTSHSIPSALDRRSAVARLLRDRGTALVVSSLGNPTYDVAASGDSPFNFYLWGAMGGAIAFGLGLAVAQPSRRVMVFAGDGEMMMGIGSLATVAVHGADNLSVVVIDNEHYAETGMQPAHAGRGVNISAVAQAVGFKFARTVRSEQELEQAADTVLHQPGPVLVTIKVSTRPSPTVLPPRDGPYLRSRFRDALLGAIAHQ